MTTPGHGAIARAAQLVMGPFTAGRWAMPNEGIQGVEWATYPALARPTPQERGIAYGARALGRRSRRSSPRLGKPTTLGIIRERGRRGLPLEDVYRQLYNPGLYLLAYGKISGNAGALTPGVTDETADGMALEKIERIIGLLRQERYRWTPARRVRIPKQNGTTRPLGIPTWSDKLLQEVIRLSLEAYYEPQFSDRSHGFRPGRGCHTALTEIHRAWTGTVWFIEGDITGCFDHLDHEVLLGILRENIHDNRFLRLVASLLKAGYLEEWRYGRTLSGTPQGGIVSPLLANIYLDRLDRFVAHDLIPAHTRGTARRRNPAYQRLMQERRQLWNAGDRTGIKELRKRLRTTPVYDLHDPNYRHLRYVRYADDFVLGFAGPRDEAEEIKRHLGEFLRDALKLELSEAKTLVTHGRTEAARFLGYELVVQHDDQRITRGANGKLIRAINGVVGLKVPLDVVRQKGNAYMRGGKPIHRAERLRNDVYSIVTEFAAEYRGLAEYYRLAYNRHQLGHLKWVMETSLTKTLAHKLKLSVAQVYRRYGTTIQTAHGPRKGLRVVRSRDGKPPLVAVWGGVNLNREKTATLNDTPARTWNKRTEIVERLLADTCELCGSREHVQVHHVKALKHLQQAGRATKPTWMKVMIARRRKKLVVCGDCHHNIHAGRPTRTANTATEDWRAG